MTKKCVICKNLNPDPLIKVCSYGCAHKYLSKPSTKKLIEKKSQKRQRKKKADAKGIKHWIKETQKVFNRYIRTRDHGLACISCGRFSEFMDAGHFKSVGGHFALRFDEKNVHGQCQSCNRFNGGRLIEYRDGLILRYGQELVDYLEGPHDLKHYTIDDLKALRKKYSAKTRDLVRSRHE